MTYSDEEMLRGVHPDMQKVYREFQSLCKAHKLDYAVRVTCGVRTLAEQKKNVARGVSKTLKSRHIPETNKSGMSEAIDLAPYVNGVPKWDWPFFYAIAAIMKDAAQRVNVPIVWGGDWKTFKDGPHFELSRSVYK